MGLGGVVVQQWRAACSAVHACCAMAQARAWACSPAVVRLKCFALAASECRGSVRGLHQFLVVRSAWLVSVFNVSVWPHVCTQDAKKGVKFVDLPPVLQLQLKRFEYDMHRDTMVKVRPSLCSSFCCQEWQAPSGIDHSSSPGVSTMASSSVQGQNGEKRNSMELGQWRGSGWVKVSGTWQGVLRWDLCLVVSTVTGAHRTPAARCIMIPPHTRAPAVGSRQQWYVSVASHDLPHC